MILALQLSMMKHGPWVGASPHPVAVTLGHGGDPVLGLYNGPFCECWRVGLGWSARQVEGNGAEATSIKRGESQRVGYVVRAPVLAQTPALVWTQLS